MKNIIQATTVPIFGRVFLRYYIITMRPYLLFVSWATGIAGLAFGHVVSVIQLWMVITAFFLTDLVGHLPIVFKLIQICAPLRTGRSVGHNIYWRFYE